jgi:geranylgeranyl diphosphate synthase type I
MAILAGDLAYSYAWQLFLEAPCPDHRRRAAEREFLATQQKVFLGQHLDVLGSKDIWRMQDLKTASYTARGPLRIGGLVAGASAEILDALDRFGTAIGVAFQLRDDLLGTFGNPATTGKPAGNDLRRGKRTALLREAERMLRPDQRAHVDAVFGSRYATDAELSVAIEALTVCGARRSVENRIDELRTEATAVLEEGAVDVPELRDLLTLLTERDR